MRGYYPIATAVGYHILSTLLSNERSNQSEEERPLMSAAVPETHQFALNEEQLLRLLSCRAVWEEGEDEERLQRLRQQEDDAGTLLAISRCLTEADFANGGSLDYSQTLLFLHLARALAPNPNLDIRLLRRPDEPAAFSFDLRDLLYGAASLPVRVRHFLTRRHAGEQTALQLLCAVSPVEYPLLSPSGRRALALTPEQTTSARSEARERFDLPVDDVANSDPALKLLTEVVIYAEIKRMLYATDYVAVYRLLTQGLAARPHPARGHTASPSRSSIRASGHGNALVRENGEYLYTTGRNVFGSETEASDTPALPIPDFATLRMGSLFTDIERAIAGQGFSFPPLLVRSLLISLQTKPFALLTGPPGTGKTRLASLLSEALTGSQDTQFQLLPVRADWIDSSPLLGSDTPFSAFQSGTPFLEFLRHASLPQNAHKVYVLCLDEMNLAHIERYAVEILSAIESPNHELRLRSGRTVRMPTNLFLIGTLTPEQSSLSIPKRVLDRANVLHLDEVRLRETNGRANVKTERESAIVGVETEAESRISSPVTISELTSELRQATFLYGRVTEGRVPAVSAARRKLEMLSQAGDDLIVRVTDALADVQDILHPYGFGVSYRVRDETLVYCANSFDVQGSGLLTVNNPEDRLANLAAALDFQLLQRVVPSLTGSQDQIETPLHDLLRWTERAAYPRTSRRLVRLLSRLQRDGSVSFD